MGGGRVAAAVSFTTHDSLFTTHWSSMFLPSNITLQMGDSGDFVAELQRRLVGVKSLSEDAVNGFFDNRTQMGVSSFQMRVGLRADGIAGPETLRRLNAVMTGGTWNDDTKTGSTSSEEEAAAVAAAAAAATAYRLMDNQSAPLTPAASDLYGNAPQQAATGWGQSAPVEPQTVQQQLMKEAQQFQQQQGQSYDQVAQNLQQQAQMQSLQQQQMQQQMMMQQQQLQQQMMAQQQTQVPPQQQPSQQIPQQGQPLVPGGFGQKPQGLPAEQGVAAVAEESAQKQGIIGKAMAKMDALVQKLASYFEAKLPPDVLSEVKHIGAVMAMSGVKESRMPEAPDQVRAQATPARAPEPMQAPTRN